MPKSVWQEGVGGSECTECVGGGELLSVVLIRQRSINILGTRGQARAGRVTRESSNGEEDEEDQRGPKRTRRTRMARMIRSLRAK